MSYQTGIPYIDTLLATYQPHWNGVGVFNSAAVVTYSFVEDRDVYNESTSPDVSVSDFSAFSAAQRSAAREAFQLWAAVANITFIEVADTAETHGDIRLLNSNDILADFGAAGAAYFPLLDGEDRQSDINESAGDLFIAPAANDTLDFSQFGFGRTVLIHEIGHALGLNHPNDVDSLATISAGENNDRYTIMTTPETSDHPYAYLVSPGDYSYVPGPMVYDIAAIQHLYGANTSTNSGDTVYSIGSNDLLISTIWDAGGIDTLDASQLTDRVIINLNPGSYSSFGGVPGPFNSYEDGTNNFGIAFNAVIENVIGTHYADTITGNAANNILEGRNGNDQLYGLDGNDTLIAGTHATFGDSGTFNIMEGGRGDDLYYLSSTFDQIVENPGEGTDTVISFFNYVLASNFENLTLVDDWNPVQATGNSLGNIITGNKQDNQIRGLGGNDSLYGGAGDDYLEGGAGDDYLAGGGDNAAYNTIFATHGVMLNGSSKSYFLSEFSLTGTLIHSFEIPYPGEERPNTETTQDILVSDSVAYIVNGRIYPYLTILSLDDGSVSHFTHPGWSYPGQVLGNITKFGNYIFVADYDTGGSPVTYLKGLIRFDLSTGQSERFLQDTFNYSDLTIGPDGYLYLHSGTIVDKYTADSIEFVSRIEFEFFLGKIAISNDGYIYAAADQHDGPDLFKFDMSGNLVSSYVFDISGLRDIEIASNGQLVLINLESRLIIFDTNTETLINSVFLDTQRQTYISISPSGGQGGDTVTYKNSSGSVDVNLLAGTAIGADGNDTLVQIENIEGSEFNDTLKGNGSKNRIEGFGGNDEIDGDANDDLMIGGAGNDIYWVDSSSDRVIENENEGLDTVKSSSTYTLADNVENLILIAGNISGTGNSLGNHIQGTGAGNVFLYGLDGDDELWAGAGNDVLDGGNGIDVMTGGAGNDIYSINHISDTIVELPSEGIDTVRTTFTYTLSSELENLELLVAGLAGTGNSKNNNLIGSAGEDVLYGLGGNDSLEGNAGNDTLDGGAGADLMKGGPGNDLYIVDVLTDQAQENFNQGQDTVISSVSYVLGANIENLVLTVSGTVGTGNNLDNTLSTEGNGNETLFGLGGNDTLSGNAGDDWLEGGAGNDILNGGSGNDTMIGGGGDDTYYYDTTQDSIVELPGAGRDHVISMINFKLDPNLEDLTLQESSSAANATGNEVDNTLIGNNNANLVSGLAGNDILSGHGGNDILLGGRGFDQLWGGAGDDYHSGGWDANLMTGGTGNDTYLVTRGDGVGTVKSGQVEDTIIEIINEGLDTVQSYVYSYSLPENIEILELTGQYALIGNGNDLDNTLVGNGNKNTLRGDDGNDIILGNSGDDKLYGGSGNDRIDGGNGRDFLEGGAGQDTFVFSDTGIDSIIDFTSGMDRLQLSLDLFGGIGSAGNLIGVGVLRSGNGAMAVDSDDYLVYHTQSGTLFYDADANGSGMMVQFASLLGAPSLSATDIWVIA